MSRRRLWIAVMVVAACVVVVGIVLAGIPSHHRQVSHASRVEASVPFTTTTLEAQAVVPRAVEAPDQAAPSTSVATVTTVSPRSSTPTTTAAHAPSTTVHATKPTTPTTAATTTTSPPTTLAPSPSDQLTFYSVGNINPQQITTNPRDGSVWFAAVESTIGRFAADGKLTEFTLPDADKQYTQGIAIAPDGAAWFTQPGRSRLGRVAPDGTLTWTPTTHVPSDPVIATPDGTIWFVAGNNIGRLKSDGLVDFLNVAGDPNAQYPDPMGLTIGPGGHVWFTTPKAVGYVNGDSIKTLGPGGMAITTGPDGNMWFVTSDSSGSAVVKMTTGGSVLGRYTLPSYCGTRFGLSAGPDGNVWVGENGSGGGVLSRVTPGGTVTEVGHDSRANGVYGVTSGPDGNVWFTTPGSVGVVKLTN